MNLHIDPSVGAETETCRSEENLSHSKSARHCKENNLLGLEKHKSGRREPQLGGGEPKHHVKTWVAAVYIYKGVCFHIWNVKRL